MSMFRRRLMIAAALEQQQPQPPLGKYIQFEDAEVERICMENFSSDGIGVSYEDAEKVTVIPDSLFKGNTKITEFNELKYFKNLKDLRYNTFMNCTNLKSIDLSNVEYLSGDNFIDCTALAIELNMPNCKRIGQRVFSHCSKITKIVNLGNTEIIQLRGIDLGKNSVCTYIELPPTLKNMAGWDPITAGAALKTLICRAVVPPSLVNPCFRDSPKCTFYVPDGSVEAYKSADNWSVYASRIKPLSEYQR